VKNYYKILQIDSSAEAEIVDAAYHRLIRKYHPDVASKNEEGTSTNEERVRDIIEAYKVLSDEAKRRNYDAELRNSAHVSGQTQSLETDPTIKHRTILMKCSVSGKTYQMYLVKKKDGTGPYIVSGFERLMPASEIHKKYVPWNDILDGFGIFTKVRAIVERKNDVEDEIHLGDIEWAGVRCPDCGKSVQLSSGKVTSFGVCSRCHRLKCMGNAIKGVAGYYTLCPWCGQNSLITRVVKPGEKGGSKINGIVDGKKDNSTLRLPEGKPRLLKK